MSALLAKFDGEKIELPDELRGAAPGDVLIIYPIDGALPPPKPPLKPHSVRDFFGKAGTKRTTEEIMAQVREERDSWDDP